MSSSKNKKQINYEHFDPKKIKIAGGKVVEIQWYDLENPNTLHTDVGTNLPDPAMQEALDELSETMARAMNNLEGYETAMEIVKEIAPGDLDSYSKLMRARDLRIADHNVSGITFIGDKKAGIQISGTLKGYVGSTGGFASPKVYFEAENISYGEKAQELAEAVRKEAYEYLFMGKWIAAEKKSRKKKNDEFVDPAQTSILDNEENAD